MGKQFLSIRTQYAKTKASKTIKTTSKNSSQNSTKRKRSQKILLRYSRIELIRPLIENR
jgi:uncharacterized phosphosugar-binding protein